MAVQARKELEAPGDGVLSNICEIFEGVIWTEIGFEDECCQILSHHLNNMIVS